MPPNSKLLVPTGVLTEHDEEVIEIKAQEPELREYKVRWFNVINFTYLHLHAAYGLYLMFTSAKLATSFQALIYYAMSIIGITAGAHRLWTHRSYKAKWPLRLLLAIFNTIAYQHHIIRWSRDHRVHHKYSETDADPHNAKRGFFFCHIGWLMCKKHPEVIAKGKQIYMSDLLADPILVFQRKYYNFLIIPLCFIIPTVVPMYFWNETFINAYSVNTFRFTFCLNCIWLVNSFAHYYGNKPYDKFINPTENIVAETLTLGEGYHNFHHTFPWDYRGSELGRYGTSISTYFINFFAKIGWAYDLKSVSPDVIRMRVQRTGNRNLWGLGGKDQRKEDYKETLIRHNQEN